MSVTTEQIRTGMEKVAKTAHPRLFADAEEFAALKQACEQTGLRHDMREYLCHLADQMIPFEPVQRIQRGRRLLSVSRMALWRINTLSMSYKLTGRPAYAERAIKEMRAVATFSDWNPSHFLDVAEMTLALSVGYDWLYDVISPEDRALFAEAILTKGLKSTQLDEHWTTMANNWGQVCHTGMIAGCLAVAEHDLDWCSQRMRDGIAKLPISMRVYAPKGCYPEGPGYWEYGTGFNVIGLALLNKAMGTDYGLSEMPGFKETGGYLDWAVGTSGISFNYSDGGAKPRGNSTAPWWFARTFKHPEFVETFERKALAATCATRNKITPTKCGNRNLAYALFWMFDEGEFGECRQDRPVVWSSEGDNPIVVMRSSWQEHAVYLGIKGGTPGANHGHMDVGSFVLDADGERWSEDLGAEDYNRIEQMGLNLWARTQNSDRWTIFRLNNYSHSTLTIDGQLQRVAGHGKFTEVDADNRKAVLDLSAVYAESCTKAIRTFEMSADGVVTVTDELEGLKPGKEILWGLTTRKTPRVEGMNAALSNDMHELKLEVLSEGLAWRITDISQPRSKADVPNANATRLELVGKAPETGKLTIKVKLSCVK